MSDNYTNQALLVVDMQKEGLSKRNVFNKQELINNVNNLISIFRKKNKPLFFIRHNNDSYLKENTEGWQFSEELDLFENDIIIDKRNINAFREPKLLSLLEESKITEVVIIGLISNMCVRATSLGGLESGFSVLLISDGHSTFYKDAEKIISECNSHLTKKGARVISTAEFIKKYI